MKRLLFILVLGAGVSSCGPSRATGSGADASDAGANAFADTPPAEAGLDATLAPADGSGTSQDVSGDVSSYVLTMPAVALAVAEETTRCVELVLDNADAALIQHIHVTLSPGSHHLIVYRSTATTLQPTPTPCAPFDAIQNGTAPLFIDQLSTSDLYIPVGVGISIVPHQHVRLEEHFINLTGAPLQGSATVTIDAVPASAQIMVADLMFWGTTSISIDPHAAGVADMFTMVQPGVNVFGLTSHEHHFGTLATISNTTDVSIPGTELYRNSNWAEPRLAQFDPPLAFDGTTGLHLHCEYFNTSDALVTFGESAATDEMCFLWAYYYPSHGFDIQF